MSKQDLGKKKLQKARPAPNYNGSPVNAQDKDRSKSMRIGPVRLIVLDTGPQYRKSAFLSICNGLVQVCLGATNITALTYTLKSGDLHACLCAAGWHFFSAEAILALTPANGWSSPLKLGDKKLFHMILQVCGFTCVVVGSVLILNSRGFTGDIHTILGLAALIATMLTVILGPLALVANSSMKTVHAVSGLPTFVLTSACYILGILKENFEVWAHEALMYILICFIVYYTLFIFVVTVLKISKRRKYSLL